MKHLSLLGSALGAGMLHILARGGWETPGHSSPNRSTRAAKPGRSLRFMRSGPTKGARHWHNPADPVQAERIEAAVAKRERKKIALRCQSILSTDFNRAHHPMHGSYTSTFDPFYVAK